MRLVSNAKCGCQGRQSYEVNKLGLWGYKWYQAKDRKVTSKGLNIALLLLSTIFLGLAYLAHVNQLQLQQMSSLARTVVGILVASPFALSFLAYMLRMRSLKRDEYQANMLRQRMEYATMAAIFYALIKGFSQQYGEAEGTPFYIWPAVFWYLIFWFSSVFGPYKP